MLIAHVEPPAPVQQGDQQYRTVQPCRALALHDDTYVVSGTWLSPQMHRTAHFADVLVLCQAVDADFLPLMQARRQRGQVTVFEINDHFLAAQVWNPVATFYNQPANRSLILQLAAQADAIQFSCQALAQEFAHLNPRQAVFVNHLWELPAQRAKPAGLRLGWGGSLGHLQDMVQLQPMLQAFLREQPHVSLAVMAPQPILDLFAWAPPGRCDTHLPASLDAYARFLQSLHVGLAPLQDTPFNRHRSDIKFVEYAAAQVAALCADAPPYRSTVRHGDNGMLFSDTAQLHSMLSTLVTEPQARQGMAERAYAAVAARLETQHSGARLQFYTDLLQRRGRTPVRSVTAARDCPAPAAQRHHAIAWGPMERHLYNGLLHQQDAAANADFAAAHALAPDFALPLLYAGRCPSTPPIAATHLSQALARQVTSCNAAYMFGQHCRAQGQDAQAARLWQAGITLTPAYAPPYEALAACHAQAGAPQRAQALLQQALQANPFHRSAATHLAWLAYEAGQTPQAQALLQENRAAGVEHWLDHLLSGKLQSASGDWSAARDHFCAALQSTPQVQLVRAHLAQAWLQLGDAQMARQVMTGGAG